MVLKKKDKDCSILFLRFIQQNKVEIFIILGGFRADKMLLSYTIGISFCKPGLGPLVVLTVRSSYLVSKRF